MCKKCDGCGKGCDKKQTDGAGKKGGGTQIVGAELALRRIPEAVAIGSGTDPTETLTIESPSKAWLPVTNGLPQIILQELPEEDMPVDKAISWLRKKGFSLAGKGDFGTVLEEGVPEGWEPKDGSIVVLFMADIVYGGKKEAVPCLFLSSSVLCGEKREKGEYPIEDPDQSFGDNVRVAVVLEPRAA